MAGLMDRANSLFTEYVHEKARLDANTHWLMEKIQEERGVAGPVPVSMPVVRSEPRAVEEPDMEQTLMQMNRDLERANDTIKRLHEERKTVEQMRVLMDELKVEKDTMRKEAINAGTECEMLKRKIKELEGRIERSEGEMAGKVSTTDKMTQRLFEMEDQLRVQKEEAKEAEKKWDRERTLLMQHVDQLKDSRESIAGAYEKGRRAGVDEVTSVKNQIQSELADTQRVIQALEQQLRSVNNEKSDLAEKNRVIPELEASVEELKKALSTERDNRVGEATRLREELVALQRESDDWRVAFETSEKHKKAALTQYNDVKAAYTILTQERATLVARLELMQIQTTDLGRAPPVPAPDLKSPVRMPQAPLPMRP